MRPAQRKKNISKLRIIAGQWRGRSLAFAQAPGLRPTGDRIRETLFNWLQNDIGSSRCLDLFAGSGALGFEAASRGAGYVLMVENNAQVVSVLRQQKTLLHANAVEVQQTTAQQFLTDFELQRSGQKMQPFDIVFLDPPFRESTHNQVLYELLNSGAVRNRGLVYLESASNSAAGGCIPEDFTVLRSKVTGGVNYQLLCLSGNNL